MVLWVLLILEFKMVPTSYSHHASSVSCFCGSCSPQRLVHVLVEDHKTQENYMYKNQDNRKSHEKINTNHENQENQAKQRATEQSLKLRELESHKYQRLEEAREEPECWSK